MNREEQINTEINYEIFRCQIINKKTLFNNDRPQRVNMNDKIKLSLYTKQLNKIRNKGFLNID